MKTVKIYIETTITGPAAPKRGGYAAALTFTRRNGDIEDRFLKGEEKGIQNQDLWKMFLEESTEHEIEIVYEKDSEYKETLQAYLQGKEV